MRVFLTIKFFWSSSVYIHRNKSRWSQASACLQCKLEKWIVSGIRFLNVEMSINGGVIVSCDEIDEKYRFGLRDSCDKHIQHHNAPESTLIFHICITPDSFTYCLRDWTRDTEKRLRSSPYSSIKRCNSDSAPYRATTAQRLAPLTPTV